MGRRAVLVPHYDAPRWEADVQQVPMELGHEVGWEAGGEPILLPPTSAKVLSALLLGVQKE